MKVFWKTFFAVFVCFVVISVSVAYVVSVRAISNVEKHLLEKNKIMVDFISREIEKDYMESKWPFSSLKKLSGFKNFIFWWVVKDDGEIYLADKASFMETYAYDYFPQLKNIAREDKLFLNRKQNYSIFVKAIKLGEKKWSFWFNVSLTEILKKRREVILSAMLIFILSLIILGSTLYFMIRHFLKPIKDLTKGAVKIGEGDFTHRVKIESQDELGQLSNSFNKMAEDLQKTTTSVVNLNREIEERKKAEEKAKQIAEEWRETFDSIADSTLIVSKDYKINKVNKAFVDAFKIKPEEVIGKHCYEVIHGLKEPWSTCPYKQSLETGKAVTEEFFEPRLGIYLQVSASPIFNEKGRVVRAVHITKDITECKKAERALRDYSKEIEQINRELDDFTYIVSHDLKEPLRSIDAFSKFIGDDYKDKLSDEGKIYLGRIRANASRMQDLIEDLLEISRIERKRNPFEEVEVEELINEVKLRLEYAIKQKNAEIIVRDKLPEVFCDRVRLAELFINLVSNAIKFVDKGQPRVEIGCSQKDNFYEFYVKDNGPGIEEQYFNKIFEIFQRLNKREEQEGTGAGLTIVKKIVEMHRGKIWVESKVGEGATFYFTIPKKKESILGKKKIGEILIEKKLITEEDVKKALEEQKRMG